MIAAPRVARRHAVPEVMPAVLARGAVAPDIVQVPARSALAIDGAGSRDGDDFRRATAALHAVTSALKLARRAAGANFRSGPLEACWWLEAHGDDFLPATHDAWRWRLRLAVPGDVLELEVAAAVRAAAARRRITPPVRATAGRVYLEQVPPELMGRILHVGAYAEAARSFKALRQRVERHGVAGAQRHLEVYLDDPRRPPPAPAQPRMLCFVTML